METLLIALFAAAAFGIAASVALSINAGLALLFLVMMFVSPFWILLRRDYVKNAETKEATDCSADELSEFTRKIPGLEGDYDYYVGAEANTDDQYIDRTHVKTGIAMEETGARICLFKQHGRNITHKIASYWDIYGSKLVEDGEEITSVSRGNQAVGAAVGWALFGGTGAIIGGLSAEQKHEKNVTRIELHIVINDEKDPAHSVCFLDIAQADKAAHKKAMETARLWQSRMEVLIKRADREIADKQAPAATAAAVASPSPAPVAGAISIADELQKLANLREKGILTAAEFADQKAKILNG